MKRLVLIAAMLLASVAHAGPNGIVLTQRNAADTGNVLRTLDNPATLGILAFGPISGKAGYLTLGPGLVASNGVLLATTAIGATGPQGAKGDAGAAGTNGTNGTNGADGAPGSTGAAGAAGVDGKSAYQLAQVSGYTGTLQQWLVSLAVKGDSGATGATGSTGATGATGAQGTQGIPGTPAPTFNFGLPVARTLAVSTAYTATNTAKPAIITVSPVCTASLTLSGGGTCTLQARVGTASLTCSGGVAVATWTNGNTGALSIGLALNQTIGSPYAVNLPTGSSFILCPIAGTFTISAAEQSAG